MEQAKIACQDLPRLRLVSASTTVSFTSYGMEGQPITACTGGATCTHGQYSVGMSYKPKSTSARRRSTIVTLGAGGRRPSAAPYYDRNTQVATADKIAQMTYRHHPHTPDRTRCFTPCGGRRHRRRPGRPKGPTPPEQIAGTNRARPPPPAPPPTVLRS